MSQGGTSRGSGRGSSHGSGFGLQPYGSSSSHVLWGQMENSSSSQFESSEAESGDSGKVAKTSTKEAKTSTNEASRRVQLEGVQVLAEMSDCSDSSNDIGRCQQPPSGYESPGELGEAIVDEYAVIAPEITQEMEKLRQVPYEKLAALLPRDGEGNVTSIGSIGHVMDACSPCAFTCRSRGCKQGIVCGFCHFTHSEEVGKMKNRKRACKTQRVRLQKKVDRLKSKIDENPEDFNPETVHLPPSIAGDKDKTEKVVAILKEHKLTAQALHVVDKYNEDKAKGKLSL